MTNEHLLELPLTRPEKCQYIYFLILTKEGYEYSNRALYTLFFEINLYVLKTKIARITVYVYTKILALRAVVVFVGLRRN